MNPHTHNPENCSSHMGDEGNDDLDPFPFSNCYDFGDISGVFNPTDECHEYDVPNPRLVSSHHLDNGDPPIEVPDIPDTCFNYISNLLREDYSDDSPAAISTLQDHMAAQVSYNRSMDAALLGDPFSFMSNHCYQTPASGFQNLSLNAQNDHHFNTFPSSSTTIFPMGSSNENIANALVGDSVLRSCIDGDVNNTLVGNLPLGVSGVLGGLVGGLQPYEQGLNLFPTPSADFLPSLLLGERNHEPWDMNMLSANLSLDAPSSSACAGSSAQGVGMMMNPNPDDARGVVRLDDSTGKARGRRHDVGGGGDEREEEGERGGKHSAPTNEVFEHVERYGDVLLCPEGRSKPGALCSSLRNSENPQGNPNKDKSSCKGAKKKRGSKVQFVDLRGLLTRCAQCVARVDLAGSYEILKQIRQNSSPYGDYLQRVAHYLANGLEARLEGRGSELSRAIDQVPPSEVLKANRVYVASVPFKILSYYTTNKTIAGLIQETNATSVHIIDFGVFYGLQWPCIIQNLAKCPTGPPRVRITGIDFPQPGFRPSERLEETGRCLAKYCEKYNVPFEYNAIAKRWELVHLDELKIERGEPLVVNCLYRSHNLYDESVDESSPRDAFLRLVRRINPNIFTHGVVNSTSSVPFFLNRFKEAMFHYTALFDLFEATMGREDGERMLLESRLYGNQALNVIACEGTERVERPESYKQWQVRTQRAGFEQVALDRELVRRARSMVRRSFREEFSYDEDGHWVVQGWKGRILYAISCWKPSQEV